jgi:hypothetical protein
MAKVSVKNVSKIYSGDKGGEVIAVNDVSLEIADREFVVLAMLPPVVVVIIMQRLFVKGLVETEK